MGGCVCQNINGVLNLVCPKTKPGHDVCCDSCGITQSHILYRCHVQDMRQGCIDLFRVIACPGKLCLGLCRLDSSELRRSAHLGSLCCKLLHFSVDLVPVPQLDVVHLGQRLDLGHLRLEIHGNGYGIRKRGKNRLGCFQPRLPVACGVVEIHLGIVMA